MGRTGVWSALLFFSVSSPAQVTTSAELPDAPSYAQPAFAGAAAAAPRVAAADAVAPAVVSTPAKREGQHWGPMLAQSAAFLSMQHAGNLSMIPYFRWQLTHGNFFDKWFGSVSNFRWTRWNDGDPFLDNYVGHPMMGSITQYIWIQNDPRGRGLGLENSRRYWDSRLRALWWSAAYSAQWKIGPLSEASIGNNGLEPLYDRRLQQKTWGTGVVDFVVTPIGGLAWTLAEDSLDRWVIAPVERRNSSPFLMLPLSILNPSRSAANILRLKAPWYRDYRGKGRVVAER